MDFQKPRIRRMRGSAILWSCIALDGSYSFGSNPSAAYWNWRSRRSNYIAKLFGF